MINFISKNIENNRLELLIDMNIFSLHIAMKAAYVFLDRAYFFFHIENEQLLLQITPKSEQDWDAEKFILEYSDELLAYSLRVQVENENRVVRETIVRRALGSYMDLPNFRAIESQNISSNETHSPDDLTQILAEIENNPDLKIDDSEIDRILAEIEGGNQKSKIDSNKLKDVKKNFQHR